MKKIISIILIIISINSVGCSSKNISNNEINKIPNNKIKEKMDKLNELNDLLKFANLNSKQKDEDEYYIRLQGLIKFELVSILPYEIKEKYESFYSRTLKKCK